MSDVDTKTTVKRPAGESIVPEGFGADLKDWPQPSEIQRDDLGRAGVPGALGGVRVTIGQSRQEPGPSADEATENPLPTNTQLQNPNAPTQPEKRVVPMKQQHME